MTGKKLLMAIAWTPLWLAGCMLPQPDTPIIPPGATMAHDHRQEGSMPTVAPAAEGLFTGAVVGGTASAIQATPEGEGGAALRQELGADGAFALTLTPGTYRIELVVDGEVAVLEPRITVEAGQDREVTLRIGRDPLTVTLEEVPEEPASPEAQATES